MNKITIVTPDNIEVEYTLASLAIRAAAAGVDMIIQMVVFGLIAMIGMMLMDFERIFSADFNQMDYIIISVLLVSYGLITYGYYVLSDIFMKGQTLGKRIYNIRIIKENGEGISAVHAIIREFLKVTVDGFGIGIVLIFINAKYKRIGDMLASTIVVCEEKGEQRIETLLSGENNYNLEDEDLQLVRDYYNRKDLLNRHDRQLFEDKVLKYLWQKYGIKMEEYNKESFIQSIVK